MTGAMTGDEKRQKLYRWVETFYLSGEPDTFAKLLVAVGDIDDDATDYLWSRLAPSGSAISVGKDAQAAMAAYDGGEPLTFLYRVAQLARLGHSMGD